MILPETLEDVGICGKSFPTSIGQVLVSIEKMTFKQAIDYCKQINGKLFPAKSSQLISEININSCLILDDDKNVLGVDYRYVGLSGWIGLMPSSRDGDQIWSDGTPYNSDEHDLLFTLQDYRADTPIVGRDCERYIFKDDAEWRFLRVELSECNGYMNIFQRAVCLINDTLPEVVSVTTPMVPTLTHRDVVETYTNEDSFNSDYFIYGGASLAAFLLLFLSIMAIAIFVQVTSVRRKIGKRIRGQLDDDDNSTDSGNKCSITESD